MNQEKMQRNLLKQLEDATYPSLRNRAAAFFIDVLVCLPFVFLFMFLQIKINKNADYLYLCVSANLFTTSLPYLYRIFFNKKFNGTPGKLLCKLKIVRADELPMTWATAFKREAIYLVLSLIYLAAYYSLFFMNMQNISTMLEFSELYAQSSFNRIFVLVNYIVFIVDFSKVRSSSKRQALHDKIANTVVVFNYSLECSE